MANSTSETKTPKVRQPLSREVWIYRRVSLVVVSAAVGAFLMYQYGPANEANTGQAVKEAVQAAVLVSPAPLK